MAYTWKELKPVFQRTNLTEIGKAQEKLLDDDSIAWKRDPKPFIPDNVRQNLIDHHKRLQRAVSGRDTRKIESAKQLEKFPATPAGKDRDREEHKTPKATSTPPNDPPGTQNTATSWEETPPRRSNRHADRPELGAVAPPETRAAQAATRSQRSPNAVRQLATTDLQTLRSSDPESPDAEVPQTEPSIVVQGSSSTAQHIDLSAALAPSPQKTPSCAQQCSDEAPHSEVRIPETVVAKRPAEGEQKQRKRLKPFAPILSPALARATLVENKPSLRNIPEASIIETLEGRDSEGRESMETPIPRQRIEKSYTAEAATPTAHVSAAHPDPASLQGYPSGTLGSSKERAYNVGLHMQRLNIDPYQAFKEIYPEYTETYSGSVRQFIKATIYLEYLQQRKRLKESSWDELIRTFSSGYIPYLNSDPPEPLSMIEWFSELSGPDVFGGGVITKQNLQYVFQKYPEQTKSVRREQKERERTRWQTHEDRVARTPREDDDVEMDQNSSYISNSNTTVHNHKIRSKSRDGDGRNDEEPELPVPPRESPETMAVPPPHQTTPPISPQLGSHDTSLPLPTADDTTVASSQVTRPRRSLPAHLEPGRRTSLPVKKKTKGDRMAKLQEHFKRRISEGFVAGTPTSSNRSRG